jgi:hypothetical protein
MDQASCSSLASVQCVTVAALAEPSGNQGLDQASKSRRDGPSLLDVRLLQQHQPQAAIPIMVDCLGR